MVNDKSGTFENRGMTSEQILVDRSDTLQDKLRRLIHHDLILKLISGILLTLDILFYLNNFSVVRVCIMGSLLLAIMSYIQWRMLHAFNKINDPALPTRDALSRLLVFLKRKTNLIEISIASSQILIFVPGLLLYFYIVYGFIKPITGFSFFVFSVLALIGTVMSYLRTRSQMGFLIRHITLSLSDLNENTLEYAYNLIEKERRQDNLIKTLITFLLILGFVLIIGVMKSLLV